MKSNWVIRRKLDGALRCRILAKGRDQHIMDMDDIYASTPSFHILRLPLTVTLQRNWIIMGFDMTTAFLNAPRGTSTTTTDDNETVYMEPPTRILQRQQIGIMETEQSHVRFTNITERLARSPCQNIEKQLQLPALEG